MLLLFGCTFMIRNIALNLEIVFLCVLEKQKAARRTTGWHVNLTMRFDSGLPVWSMHVFPMPAFFPVSSHIPKNCTVG